MKLLLILLGLLVLSILILIIEAFIARQGVVPFTNNPTGEIKVFGADNSDTLNYLVIGDSTAAGQGADYNKGIATTSAEYLAEKSRVNLKNIAVSGAKMNDVLIEQLPRVGDFKPDIVLISAGANDVTQLSSRGSVEQDLAKISDKLRVSNPKVNIFITGSPEMGAVPRLLQPLRFAAKIRTAQMNDMFGRVAKEEALTFIQIAKKTGPIFESNPELFDQDKFHPNALGYAEWNKVIIESLKNNGF